LGELLQVVFAAEHVSAQAARALPGVAADAGGFLHLCLSDPGAAGPTGQSGDHHTASVANCLLCASAAVGAFADDARSGFSARVARVAITIRWMAEASIRRPDRRAAHDRARQRSRDMRAPPQRRLRPCGGSARGERDGRRASG
jgi:hypothetical protein